MILGCFGAAFRYCNGVGLRNPCFRGSITRPAHSLSTLRRRAHARSTQDSLPAGDQPLPGDLVLLRQTPKEGFSDVFSFYVLVSSLHRLPWRTADPILHVAVAVVVAVADQRHILLSICTIRRSSERPVASATGLATCSTLHASRIAAHSIAEPRAIA
jgi:hypothetical protein